MAGLETKIEEKSVKPENVNFDNLISVISDPTTEDKAKKLAEGFALFYQNLQKKYCKDKGADKKKEMGITEDIFVPDVKPIMEERKAKDIIDRIAIQYAKNVESKIVQNLAKQLEESKSEDSKKTAEEIEQIRIQLFTLTGIDQHKLMNILKNYGLKNELGEELAKRMAEVYVNDKQGPYVSRITDYQKEPLVDYLAGKVEKLDSTKLKTLDIDELKKMLAVYAKAKKEYEANKKVIEENKVIKEEEKEAKLKEIKKIFEKSFSEYSSLYKSEN